MKEHFCALLVVAVLLGTAAALMPSAQALQACTTCTCSPTVNSTPMVWGHGPTCSDAFDDGVAQAQTHINCANGVCEQFVIIDNACALSGGQYMIDLHIDYRCYVCSGTLCPKKIAPYEEVLE